MYRAWRPRPLHHPGHAGAADQARPRPRRHPRRPRSPAGAAGMLRPGRHRRLLHGRRIRTRHVAQGFWCLRPVLRRAAAAPAQRDVGRGLPDRGELRRPRSAGSARPEQLREVDGEPSTSPPTSRPTPGRATASRTSCPRNPCSASPDSVTTRPRPKTPGAGSSRSSASTYGRTGAGQLVGQLLGHHRRQRCGYRPANAPTRNCHRRRRTPGANRSQCRAPYRRS